MPTESGGRLVVGHLFKSFRSFICLFVCVCSGSDFPMEVRGKLGGILSLLPSGARGWNGLVQVSWGALFPTEPLTCYVDRSDLELLIVLLQASTFLTLLAGTLKYLVC